MRRTSLRTVVLFAVPLVFAVIACWSVFGYSTLYSEHLVQDAARLDERLRAAGGSPDQNHAIVASASAHANATQGFVTGVALTVIGTTTFCNMALVGLLFAAARRDDERTT